MEQLASIFLHSRTQSHEFHLKISGPGSFAIHKALMEYYEGIIPIIDGLVEAYQGQFGLIEFKSVTGIDNNATKENIIAYFDKLILFLNKERKSEKLQESWIQNELDNIAKLLYSTKYKLVNLA